MMPLVHCSNPVCHLPLDRGTNNNLTYYCASCNKHFCTHCINHRTINGGEVNTCIYCNEVLSSKQNKAPIVENENLALAIEKRLAMGEQGQKLQKAYCLKCYREVVVSNLAELPSTTCTNCGTSYFMDVAGIKYQGKNNTYQLTEETQSKSFISFIEDYKTYKLRAETNPLWGKVELNNWLYKNIIAIDTYKLAEVYKEQFPDDAEIFKESINQFNK